MASTALRKRPRRDRGRRFSRQPALGREPTLADRYELERGRILLTGVQALVRLPLDQHRADLRRGLRTGTLVSGYQGSPLGGLDKELARIAELCSEHHVFHVPGLNEELGATAAWGSQLAAGLPGASYDGAIGIWYGKAPGLDRAMDSLRHGNFAGVSRTGGGLAIVGDDPAAKSSTLPSASESAFRSLGMPVLFPGDVQEVLDLGLHALGLSRASGLWTGFKIVTSVADALGTAEVAPDRVRVTLPETAAEHVPNGNLLAPASLELERTLVGERTRLALEYARVNGVNRIEGARDAWLGIACAGKTYFDVRQALADLGLPDERALERAGVRILKLGLLWPLEPDAVHELGRGVEEIVVVEEKGPFLESLLKETLYGAAHAPRVVGKHDEVGEQLVPVEGELDADRVARILGARLLRRVRLDSVVARLAALDQVERRRVALPLAARTPFFCSGCPHNSSVKAPDGTLVGAGIGCHTMVLLNPAGKGELTGITQMGGEGAQWIGMAPFTDERHYVQNLGDGTFSHSGSLALRAAVSAGVNVTYKLLWNGAVAMTGGQEAVGSWQIPELTRLLQLEGVVQTVITTEDRKRYRGADLAANVTVRKREDLLAVQEELAAVEGVTVLIHDGECAAEKRRKRKRGQAPEPARRVWINERVCEGCGDCGAKSSCLSVQPVETEFGRKTQIHQASCNKDFTCLEGDCPSFVTVVPGKRAKHVVPEPPADLPDPELRVGADPFTVRMLGIGGTGVVTVNQVLAYAALMDGLDVDGLDQTGLSQKGGPVVSDLRLSRTPRTGSPRAQAASADLLLGFDLLGAANPRNLSVADPERSVAVVSTHAAPTGRMVVDPAERFPELDPQLEEIERFTRARDNLYVDAQALAELLFGDHMPANTILLGAAYQRGALPVSAGAIERAIRLNGAAVEQNLAAFAWGRAIVADPDAVAAATRPPEAPQPEPSDAELALIDSISPRPALRELLELRVPELLAYQDLAYAERYVDFVGTVAVVDAEMAEAVAQGLFKLMAYKDEYEVARLHLDEVERVRRDAEFGPGAKVWINLHPPVLRALGLKRKLKLGRWFVPVLRLLRSGRRLRGTALDPFGQTRVRRMERALVREYTALIEDALTRLGPENRPLVRELCELPDEIRGYEDIKLRAVERYRERADELTRRLA